jgi:DNA repair photolyase
MANLINDNVIPFKGRGASWNPPNRFEALSVSPNFELTQLEYEPDCDPEERPAPKTQYFKDATQTIVSRNDSPDVGFDVSINPYRGCEHGCIYCYARPTHEFLSLSAGLDFETKIFVKDQAPRLLRKELENPNWEPKTIAISGVTDAYQPAERNFRLTRACLEVLSEFRNPVAIITKSRLVTRDLDLLLALNKYSAVRVYLSVTTLDSDLCGILEPRTSRPARRLEAVRELASHGIPVGVLVAPVIPGITDHEIPSILKAAADAGAKMAGYVPLRLPLTVAPLFENWLMEHMPDRAEKVLNRIRSMRNGKLNDSAFGSRMQGEGEFAKSMAMLFASSYKRFGFSTGSPPLATQHFHRPLQGQLELF